MRGPTRSPAGTAASRWTFLLAWSALVLEGFDLVVLGTLMPVLLEQRVWGLTPASATVVSTLGLVGMLFGALGIGLLTDVLGRRLVLIWCVAGFSLFTLLCAFAPSIAVFGLWRFLAGIGLGGCLPTVIAMIGDRSRAGQAYRATTTLTTGYHVGAVLTALLGIVVVPVLGWRALFVIGAAPALVLVPLMARFLPESAPARQVRSPLTLALSLLRADRRRSTIAFCVASFMGLLLVYGLNTWLPQIMRSAGYQLGSALLLLLLLNAGAIAGLLIAGAVADKNGVRGPVVVWFTASALLLATLSVRMPQPGIHVAVFLTGGFVFSAQVLVYAYIGQIHDAGNRATAIGCAAGLGRLGAISGPIIGGMLLTAGVAYPWGFYVFAIVGALGAVAVTGIESGQTSASGR